jgi:hypothetical protein
VEMPVQCANVKHWEVNHFNWSLLGSGDFDTGAHNRMISSAGSEVNKDADSYTLQVDWAYIEPLRELAIMTADG